jgi:hypothetical protein
MLRPACITAILALLAAGTVPAVAQAPVSTITVDAEVIPNKAGTPSRPQGVMINSLTEIETPEGFEKPIVQVIDVYFPKGGVYNGGKYPSCSQRTMARNRGVSKCPKESIMGQGQGLAYADDVFTRPKITVVNGGADKVYFFTTLSNPARVQAPVLGRITKPGGRWSYKLHVEVPKVLQVVAGVPIAAKQLRVTAGGKPWAKDWIATTFCPRDRLWRYHVDAFLSNGTVSRYDGTVPCR